MSAKHTPGPWHYPNGAYVTDGHGMEIAICPTLESGKSRHAFSCDTAMANAALIASAPDLLTERDALRAQVAAQAASIQELREALEKIVITASTRKADHRLCTLEIADAALAKVTPA